jgi:hypothetical protein
MLGLKVSVALGLALATAFAGDVGSIKGRVLGAENGKAVFGAAVELEGTDIGATTTEDGFYQIDSIPSGTWTVQVFAVAYESESSTVDVVAGTTISLDFKLQYRRQVSSTASGDTFGTVRGRVRDDSTEAPIADALVEVSGTDLWAATDLSGAYSIGEFPRGNQRIRVRAAGYSNVAVDTVRCDWCSKTLDFRLKRMIGRGDLDARQGKRTLVSPAVSPNPAGPPPQIEWSRTFAGLGESEAYSVRATADGGCLISGSTTDGKRDLCPYLVKTDSLGAVEWDRTYTAVDFTLVNRTRDGGYVAWGEYPAAHLTRLDRAGVILWSKNINLDPGVRTRDVRQTSDGGYVLGIEDDTARVTKLDSAGNVAWSVECGELASYYSRGRFSCCQTRDGSYVSAGQDAKHRTQLTKLDKNGIVIWKKSLGGSFAIAASSDIEPTPDGGFVVAGHSAYSRRRRIFYYASLTRFSARGRGVWRGLFSQSNVNEFYSVAVTRDGGFLAAGETFPLSGSHLAFDPDGEQIHRGYVVSTDSRGRLRWSLRVGPDSVYSDAQGIAETQDGGCVVTGTQGSLWGANERIYLLKFAPAEKH